MAIHSPLLPPDILSYQPNVKTPRVAHLHKEKETLLCYYEGIDFRKEKMAGMSGKCTFKRSEHHGKLGDLGYQR